MNKQLSQIKRKICALRIAFGCAVRVFRKVYHNASTFYVSKGDTIIVEYKLEIN